MITEGGFTSSLDQAVRKNYAQAVIGLLHDGFEAGHSIDLPIVARVLGKRYEQTALHLAATLGNEGICRILLDHGASPEARNQSGRTVLIQAIAEASEKSCVAVVELLLARGAHAGAVTPAGESALHAAVAARSRIASRAESGLLATAASGADMLAITRLLVQHGANPDFVPAGANNRYRTPFQTAVREGMQDQVRLFVEEFGVDWTQKTLSNKAMHQLADDPEMRALLLSYRTGRAVAAAIDTVDRSAPQPHQPRRLSPL